MTRKSAGVLLYKQVDGTVLVLLVHPGGPFWRRRDLGAWSIPKGEYETGEEPEAAAYREFMEETGYAPQGALHPLSELRQRSGKIVTAFATAGDFDAAALLSNTFEMEWPPGSGRVQSFPEVDRAEWFTCRKLGKRSSSANNLSSIGWSSSSPRVAINLPGFNTHDGH